MRVSACETRDLCVSLAYKNFTYTRPKVSKEKKIVERHSVREQSNIASTLNSLTLNYLMRKKRGGVIILVNPRAAIFHGLYY